MTEALRAALDRAFEAIESLPILPTNKHNRAISQAHGALTEARALAAAPPRLIPHATWETLLGLTNQLITELEDEHSCTEAAEYRNQLKKLLAPPGLAADWRYCTCPDDAGADPLCPYHYPTEQPVTHGDAEEWPRGQVASSAVGGTDG